MGRVEAIYVKRVRRGPMDAVPQAELVAERGIVGNANQGSRRQVTVLAQEVWDAVMAELSGSLPPSARRANLVVSGLALAHTRGQQLLVGDARLQIMGETRPCERMEEALPGLEAALREHWRGGVFAAVLEGGVVRVGDPAALEPAAPAGE